MIYNHTCILGFVADGIIRLCLRLDLRQKHRNRNIRDDWPFSTNKHAQA